MKQFLKEFILRSFMAAGGGPVVLAMIYGIIGNNPVIGNEVAVIDTYVYSSMRSLGYSYSTAIGLFQSVMGLILVTLCNKVAKKINEGEGLF